MQIEGQDDEFSSFILRTESINAVKSLWAKMTGIAYSTPKPPHISVQTLPAIPAETGHPLHPKPYHPFQSKVGHPFQSKPAVQAG